MLAQNFKTPDDLGLKDAEFDALAATLKMLEREEIEPPMFTMCVIGRPECGTPGCLLGWARSFGGHDLFNADDFTMQLGELFLFSSLAQLGDPAWVKMRASVKPDHAAIALRNFLTHGEPRWAEAISG